MVDSFRKLVEEIKLVKQVKATQGTTYLDCFLEQAMLAVTVLLCILFVTFLVIWGVELLFAIFVLFLFLPVLMILYLPLGAAFNYILCLLDFGFHSCLRYSGTIAEKKYYPASGGSFHYMGPGYVVLRHDYTIPTTYRILIRMQAVDIWYSSLQSFYDSLSIGDSVYVSYITGRFSGQVYLQKVWK
jgi:hypothetical protein